MSNEKHLALTPWSSLLTKEGFTRVIGPGDSRDLTLDDLGEIAEWLYVAWENVSGEKYRPILISDKGYVADAGEIVVEPVVDDGNGLELSSASLNYLADALSERLTLERDCE